MSKKIFVSFAEVKEKCPLPEVWKILGLSFKEITPTKFKGVCPFPTHRHGPVPNADQFRIDFKGGLWLWHCFSNDCGGVGGDVVEFVKRVLQLSDAHARLWFWQHFSDRLTATAKQNANIRKKAPTQPAATESKSSLPSQPPTDSPAAEREAPLKALSFYLQLDADAAYLRERGVSAETINRFEIGLARKGIMKGRIAIPISWHDGEQWIPVGYAGRFAGEDFAEHGEPRWLLPKNFPKKRVLFGLQQAIEDAPDAPAVVIVENPFAVFHLRQNGLPSAVALLGSSLSEEQAEVLAATKKPVVIMLDGDEAGVHGANQAADKLITRTWVRIVRLAEEQQPDRMNADELREALSFLL